MLLDDFLSQCNERATVVLVSKSMQQQKWQKLHMEPARFKSEALLYTLSRRYLRSTKQIFQSERQPRHWHEYHELLSHDTEMDGRYN
jgi:hypothetical protein